MSRIESDRELLALALEVTRWLQGDEDDPPELRRDLATMEARLATAAALVESSPAGTYGAEIRFAEEFLDHAEEMLAGIDDITAAHGVRTPDMPAHVTAMNDATPDFSASAYPYQLAVRVDDPGSGSGTPYLSTDGGWDDADFAERPGFLLAARSSDSLSEAVDGLTQLESRGAMAVSFAEALGIDPQTLNDKSAVGMFAEVRLYESPLAVPFFISGPQGPAVEAVFLAYYAGEQIRTMLHDFDLIFASTLPTVVLRRLSEGNAA